MTYDNYMDAISEAQNLLKELVNDPEHGNLTFKGKNGLGDMIVANPEALNVLLSGVVVSIRGDEWMALTHDCDNQRQWQSYESDQRLSNGDLYILALKNANALRYVHRGY